MDILDPAERELSELQRVARSVQLSLVNYQVFDGRDELDGAIEIHFPENVSSLRGDAWRFELTVRDLLGGNILWRHDLAFDPSAPQERYAFMIPPASVGGGYKVLSVELFDANGTAMGIGDVLPDRPFYGYRRLLFCVAQRAIYPASVPSGTSASRRYLGFVREITERLIAHQSAYPGNDTTLPRCICAPAETRKTYTSMGSTRADGTPSLFVFPEHCLEVSPYRMDFSAIPLLEQLSGLTGDGRYAALAGGMIDVMARWGFHDRTGLGWFGEECDFDVIERCGAGRGSYFMPKYKGGNTSALPDGPLEPLWTACPDKMLRMARSIYLGLMTDPAPGRMHYNRFCRYNFDDRDGTHPMKPSAGHCAFISAGAQMIHAWSHAFVHSGDGDFLDWSQRMADKWQAVQHPQSGLMPDLFGNGEPDDPNPVPVDFAGIFDGSAACRAFSQGAEQFARRPEGQKLAAQLDGMALAMARGIARHAYDADTGIYRQWRSLDGSAYPHAARYTFSSEAERDAAAKDRPELSAVSVYNGCSFYRGADYWKNYVGVEIPYRLAQVAGYYRDAELIGHLEQVAQCIMDQAAAVDGPIVEGDCWTYYATGIYLKLLVLLSTLSDKRDYLADACTLADMEIAHLAQLDAPLWWTHPERSWLIGGLLDLVAALG